MKRRLRIKADKFNSLGIRFYYKSDFKRAISCWNKAKTIFEKLKDKKGIGSSLNNIALVYKAKKDYKTALKYFRKSIKAKEEVRSSIVSLKDRKSFLEMNFATYGNAIECSVKLNNTKTTFNLINSTRARVFSDQLAESKVDIKRGVPVKLIKRLKDVKSRIDKLYKSLIDLKSNPLAQFAKIAKGKKIGSIIRKKFEGSSKKFEINAETLWALRFAFCALRSKTSSFEHPASSFKPQASTDYCSLISDH